MTLSRSPLASSSSITTFMYGIVVVSSALIPRMSGSCSSMRGDVVLGRVVDPEVEHLEPGALEHHRRRGSSRCRGCRPSRCRSRRCPSARRRSRPGAAAGPPCPAFIAFAASSTSGTNRIPSRKSMPTIRIPSTSASFSTLSAAQPAVEQDRRPLVDLVGEPVVQVVVHLLHEVVVGSADRTISSSLMSPQPFSRSPLGSNSGSAAHRGRVPFAEVLDLDGRALGRQLGGQVAVDDAACRSSSRSPRSSRTTPPGRRAGSAPCPSPRAAGRRTSCRPAARRARASRIVSSASRPWKSLSHPTANPRPASNGSCSVSMSWPQSR